MDYTNGLTKASRKLRRRLVSPDIAKHSDVSLFVIYLEQYPGIYSCEYKDNKVAKICYREQHTFRFFYYVYSYTQ